MSTDVVLSMVHNKPVLVRVLKWEPTPEGNIRYEIELLDTDLNPQPTLEQIMTKEDWSTVFDDILEFMEEGREFVNYMGETSE